MPKSQHAGRRLEHLYEISKLLITFESIEETFDRALGIAAETLSLRSAILIEERGGRTRMICWPSEGRNSEMMAAAKAHAEAAFRYLAGVSATEALDLLEQSGRELPAPTQSEPESLDRKRFIVIPLAVEGHRLFGTLQIEGATSLNEQDLLFVNAVANQLALAVDRHRAWQRDIVLREHAEQMRAGAEAKEVDADRRRLTAEALMERYQALVDNLDRAFVWEADARTLEIHYVSARAEALLGYPRAEWIDREGWWREHVHPKDWERVHATFESAFFEGQDQRCEHRCIARDGSEVWLRTGVHLAEADTDTPRLQGVSVDITAAKKAEDAQRFLLESSRTLGAALDDRWLQENLAHIGIPKLGDRCVFYAINGGDRVVPAAWARADRVERESPGDVLPLDVVADAIRDGTSILVRHADRSWVAVPITLADRPLGGLSYAFDDPRRSHTAADLALAEELARRAAFPLENARLYEATRHAVRLREQILGIVSHDLRTPLSTILMTTFSLVSSEASEEIDPALSKGVDRIRRAAERMERLIGDLLDFASIEAEHFAIDRKAQDPASIVTEAMASFESIVLDEGVRLTSEMDASLPTVLCDRDRILQILSNLVGNSVKVTRQGMIRVSAHASGNEVVFAVSDTGPGIKADEISHLFERYWRSSQAGYKGTGLGLAIVRGIVEAHGGRIWAESQVGEGATFFFTLPVAPEGDSRLETHSGTPA